MASWLIERLEPEDLEGFLRCRFEAFVGNPLHDVVYPDRKAAVEAHRKAIREATDSQPGNETSYLKAVEVETGKVIGGIKCCFYGAQDVRNASPYAAGISSAEGGTDDERYARYVVNEFLQKRVNDIKGQHALGVGSVKHW
ncbi:hypothetical protein LTR37_020649 [Vermiconidia calcicola]|uniref:Uncharacterized protein n=1 Tax=Vermiconidia calcicola TaxID=1690605 RepID=A0ACC3MDS1_9PEZI|nr:hypothetical protein LTR37_020649 [Vermiconidia calcicola]